jgi:hypothetical protein
MKGSAITRAPALATSHLRTTARVGRYTMTTTRPTAASRTRYTNRWMAAANATANQAHRVHRRSSFRTSEIRNTMSQTEAAMANAYDRASTPK